MKYNTSKKKFIYILAIIIAIILLGIVGMFFIESDNNNDIDSNNRSISEYQINLVSQNIIIVDHISGRVLDDIRVEVDYRTQDRETYNISINKQMGSSSIVLSRNSPMSAQLYNNDNLITSKNFSSDNFRNNESNVNISNIEDREVRLDTNVKLNAFDYTNIKNESMYEIIWSMGDGKTYQDHIINHTYTSTGNYTVKLKIESKETRRLLDENSVNINVIKGDLIDNIEVEGQLIAGNEVSFLGSESISRKADNIEWNIDGQIYREKNLSHTFDKPGSYTVELVASENGQTYFESTVIIVVSR